MAIAKVYANSIGYCDVCQANEFGVQFSGGNIDVRLCRDCLCSAQDVMATFDEELRRAVEKER